MGLGAIIGAVLTMYSAVVARTREIATLRALGFGVVPGAALHSRRILVLALVGGVLGGALAYVGFNGFQTSTMNWQTFSQVAFGFAVTPNLLMQGLIYALIMGFLGGIVPGDSRGAAADFEGAAGNFRNDRQSRTNPRAVRPRRRRGRSSIATDVRIRGIGRASRMCATPFRMTGTAALACRSARSTSGFHLWGPTHTSDSGSGRTSAGT